MDSILGNSFIVLIHYLNAPNFITQVLYINEFVFFFLSFILSFSFSFSLFFSFNFQEKFEYDLENTGSMHV